MEEVMKPNYGENNQAGGPGRGKEPLFYVETKIFDENPIPAHEINKV
jgi:hypothetical protein